MKKTKQKYISLVFACICYRYHSFTYTYNSLLFFCQFKIKQIIQQKKRKKQTTILISFLSIQIKDRMVFVISLVYKEFIC